MRQGDPSGGKAGVPSEVLQAWVQFLRDDVANSVNALNNRLNAILAAAQEIRADRLTPAERAELEKIQTEVRRAVAINSRLLARTGAMAPETVPRMLKPFEQPPARPAHILVVEDDADNRVAVTRLLQRLDHYVTACANGVEALELLELGPVDCIICDLRMPGLGGRNLYEQVEERMPTMAGRFVFVTGDYTYPESRKFLDRCGQPVVAKPYEVAELVGAVAVILRRIGVLAEPFPEEKRS